MIVYNVKRRWFEQKADAERYRVDQGLKPAATHKVEVHDRTDLACLLNALCEPQNHSAEVAAVAVHTGMVDDAYVDPLADLDWLVPQFIKDEDERRRTGKYGSGLLP